MLYKENNIRKSRELKFSEFFETLQIEYIIAELRYRIYPKGGRRNKSKDIMEGKYKKIADIAIRNHMDTIFKDIALGEKVFYSENLRNRLYGRVYPKFGYPNFVYRDVTQKNLLADFDRDCYYKIGSRFIVEGVGEGILKDVSENGLLLIDVDGVIGVYDDEKIKRKFQELLK